MQAFALIFILSIVKHKKAKQNGKKESPIALARLGDDIELHSM